MIENGAGAKSADAGTEEMPSTRGVLFVRVPGRDDYRVSARLTVGTIEPEGMRLTLERVGPAGSKIDNVFVANNHAGWQYLKNLRKTYDLR